MKTRSDRINIGSGPEVAPGYVNLENSPLLLLHWISPGLERVRAARALFDRCFGSGRREALREFHRSRGQIRYSRITTRLPFADSSLQFIYSSHFLEHIAYEDALKLLTDCHRCLMPKGIIRICVPNLRYEIDCYLNGSYETDGPMADRFVERLLFVKKQPVRLRDRLKYAVWGPRMHQWMYDSESLVTLFRKAGFETARSMEFRQSDIPEVRHLDLERRREKSLYVEATRSGSTRSTHCNPEGSKTLNRR